MSHEAIALLAAVIQGFNKTANEPITEAEAVFRARTLYSETIRQLRDQTHRPEVPHA